MTFMIQKGGTVLYQETNVDFVDYPEFLDPLSRELKKNYSLAREIQKSTDIQVWTVRVNEGKSSIQQDAKLLEKIKNMARYSLSMREN